MLIVSPKTEGRMSFQYHNLFGKTNSDSRTVGVLLNKSNLRTPRETITVLLIEYSRSRPPFASTACSHTSLARGCELFSSEALTAAIGPRYSSGIQTRDVQSFASNEVFVCTEVISFQKQRRRLYQCMDFN